MNTASRQVDRQKSFHCTKHDQGLPWSRCPGWCSWPLAPELDETSWSIFSFLLWLVLLKKNATCFPWSTSTGLKRRASLFSFFGTSISKPIRRYQYSQFCRLYRQWAERLDPPLVKNIGRGKNSSWTMPDRRCLLWIPHRCHHECRSLWRLWSSNYTFAEATASRIFPLGFSPMSMRFASSEESQRSHPDNLRAAVTRSCAMSPTSCHLSGAR